MHCANCGSQLGDNDQFCVVCGSPVRAATQFGSRAAQQQPLPYYRVESTAKMSQAQQQASFQQFRQPGHQENAYQVYGRQAYGQQASGYQAYARQAYDRSQNPYQQQPGGVYQQPSQPQQSGKSGIGRIIMFIIVALAVAGATSLGVYAFLNHLGPFASLVSASSAAGSGKSASGGAANAVEVPDEYVGTWLVVSMNEGDVVISPADMAMYNSRGRFIFVKIEQGGAMQRIMEDTADSSRNRIQTGSMDADARTATLNGETVDVHLSSDAETLVIVGEDWSMTCQRSHS